MSRKHSEVKNLKISGTKFDRRTKLTPEDREEIFNLFKHKDEIGFTYKDIADAYGISLRHLGRCRSSEAYKAYLERQKQDTQRYKENNPEAFKNKTTFEYKCALLDIIDKYKLKSIS